jgi:hypothetical protein
VYCCCLQTSPAALLLLLLLLLSSGVEAGAAAAAAAAGGGLGEVDADDDGGLCSVLLEGRVIFLAREVPREPLLFMIR